LPTPLRHQKKRKGGREILLLALLQPNDQTVRGCCPSSVVLHLLLLFVSRVFFGNLWRRRRTVQGLLPLAPQQKVKATYH
jgi:hypothetical protein